MRPQGFFSVFPWQLHLLQLPLLLCSLDSFEPTVTRLKGQNPARGTWTAWALGASPLFSRRSFVCWPWNQALWDGNCMCIRFRNWENWLCFWVDHHFDQFGPKHPYQTLSIPVFRVLESSKLEMPEELRLGVKLVEIMFKKPTWMARSAEECEMELHHRHSCLDTLSDLMMFFPLERNDSFVDPPVAYFQR